MATLRPSRLLLSLLVACGPADDDPGETDGSDTGETDDTATDTDLPGDTGADDTGPEPSIVDEEVAALGVVEGPTDLCAFGDDLTTTCGDGPEWVTRFTAPWDGEFLFKPSSLDFQLTLSLHDDDANANERSCGRTADGTTDTDSTTDTDTDEVFTRDDGLVASMSEGDSVLIGLGQDDCLDNDLLIRGRPSCIPDLIETRGLYVGFDEPLDALGNGVVTPEGRPQTTVETFAGNRQVPGVYGQAIGQDTCVVVAHNEDLWPGALSDGDVTFTWSAWFKTDTKPASGEVGILMELRDCVYDCPAGPNADTSLLRLFMADDGTVRAFSRRRTFSSQHTLSSPDAYDDGLWHHVVVTREPGDVPGFNFSLYVDGQEVDAAAIGPLGYNERAGDEPLSIGCGLTQNTSTPTADFPFPGAIDSVAAWPTPLEAADIQQWHTCVTTTQSP